MGFGCQAVGGSPNVPFQRRDNPNPPSRLIRSISCIRGRRQHHTHAREPTLCSTISPDDRLAFIRRRTSTKENAMTDEELRRLFILLHRPIPWDPVPWWIKLNKDQEARFNELQTS